MSRKRQYLNLGGEGDDFDKRSIANSEWTLDLGLELEEGTSGNINHGNAMNELKWAAFEAKQKMLETKLENQELKAKMKEQKFEKEILKKIQQKMDEQSKEIGNKMEQKMDEHSKEIGNKMEQKMDEHSKEIVKKIEQQEAVFAKKLATLEEKQKVNLDLVNEENAAIWEKLADKTLEQATIHQPNHHKVAKVGNVLAAIEPEEEENGDLLKDIQFKKPERNGWSQTNQSFEFSNGGLNVNTNAPNGHFLYALEGFNLSVDQFRMDNFQGTILYYFEATKTRMTYNSRKLSFYVGLSHANLPDDSMISRTPNLHAFSGGRNYCYINGKKHHFEWQEGVKKPVWNDIGDVLGCGLLLSPTNKVDIFFTGNGVLMGSQIPIDHPGENRLYPTIKMNSASLTTNFGDNLVDEPFVYDIKKCRGLVFE